MSDLTIQKTAALSPANEPSNNRSESIERIAGRFEALLLESMLKSMRSSLEGDPLVGDTHQSTYQEMLDRRIVEKITQNGGLGIQKLLIESLGHLTADTPTNANMVESTLSDDYVLQMANQMKLSFGQN